MKIQISSIKPGGMAIAAEAGKDKWFAALLREALPETFHAGQPAHLDLHLEKVCANIALTGQLTVDVVPACARCLERFPYHWELPLKLNLAPKPGDEVDDDAEFGFYSGEELDLGPLVREMILLEIPIRYLCKENCRGLCVRCGADLNRGPCACPPQERDSPFKVLKKLIS